MLVIGLSLGLKTKYYDLANVALALKDWSWTQTQGQHFGGLACSRPTKFTFYSR